MNEKAVRALEFDKIIERLEEKASSQAGKALCRELRPITELDQIRFMQSQTSDALSRLFKKGSLSFRGVRDIGSSIKDWKWGVL